MLIANAAISVLCFNNAIELQIHGVQPGSLCFVRKVWVLRESNSIRRDMHPTESDAIGVANRFKQNRRNHGVAT
jgi:hypothetical protein